jgi:hypothetical protein
MVIDVIVTRATCIFKPPLKIHHKETKTRKRSLNSFEMSSMKNFRRRGWFDSP